MSRDSHLSVRVSREQKEALERAASRLDLSVGQLVRRAVDQVVGTSGPTPTPVAVRRRATSADEPDPRRERELQWLDRHASELHAWAGEWLVLEAEEVVAHGRDYLKVLAAARERGIRIPFVFRIPEECPAGTFFMGL